MKITIPHNHKKPIKPKESTPKLSKEQSKIRKVKTHTR